jgi:hypothetical protein
MDSTISTRAPGRNRTCDTRFRKPLRNLRRGERLRDHWNPFPCGHRSRRRRSGRGSLTVQRTGILQRSLRLARDGARDQVSKRRLATVPLSAARRLPSDRAVYSRREALADPQGSLNSVPLGPRCFKRSSSTRPREGRTDFSLIASLAPSMSALRSGLPAR